MSARESRRRYADAPAPPGTQTPPAAAPRADLRSGPPPAAAGSPRADTSGRTRRPIRADTPALVRSALAGLLASSLHFVFTARQLEHSVERDLLRRGIYPHQPLDMKPQTTVRRLRGFNRHRYIHQARLEEAQ